MINDESVPSSCILLLLGVLMREKEVWSLLFLQHGITVQMFCGLSLAPEEFKDTPKGSPLCGGLQSED